MPAEFYCLAVGGGACLAVDGGACLAVDGGARLAVPARAADAWTAASPRPPGEAEALLPVFAALLAFAPGELSKARAGLELLARGDVPVPAAAAAVDTASSVLGAWTSWLAATPKGKG